MRKDATFKHPFMVLNECNGVYWVKRRRAHGANSTGRSVGYLQYLGRKQWQSTVFLYAIDMTVKHSKGTLQDCRRNIGLYDSKNEAAQAVWDDRRL